MLLRLAYNNFSFSGLLETISNTENSKNCPGVCVHALATIICYDVLEDVACDSPSMRCCIESAPTNVTSPDKPLQNNTDSFGSSNIIQNRPTDKPTTSYHNDKVAHHHTPVNNANKGEYLPVSTL